MGTKKLSEPCLLPALVSPSTIAASIANPFTQRTIVSYRSPSRHRMNKARVRTTSSLSWRHRLLSRKTRPPQVMFARSSHRRAYHKPLGHHRTSNHGARSKNTMPPPTRYDLHFAPMTSEALFVSFGRPPCHQSQVPSRMSFGRLAGPVWLATRHSKTHLRPRGGTKAFKQGAY